MDNKNMTNISSKDKIKYVYKIFAAMLLTGYYAYYWVSPKIEHNMTGAIFVTCGYCFLIWLTLKAKDISHKWNSILEVLLFLLTPFGCYAIVEFLQNGYLDQGLVQNRGPGIILLNLTIYFICLMIILLFTGSIRLSVTITYVFFTILSVIMYYVMMLRGTGFIITDVASAGTGLEVAGDYNFNFDCGTYESVGICILGVMTVRKTRTTVVLNLKKRVAMAVSGVLLIGIGGYVFLKSDMTDAIKIKTWLPQDSYARYGSVLTFLESQRYAVIKSPEGYSAKKAEKIAAEYRVAEHRTDKEYIKPNVIVIMNESFCDLQSFANTFSTNKEVLPFYNGLKKNAIKGSLYVSNVGGGTAISEFEMLTGNTNAFLPERGIAYQTAIKKGQPSLATELKSQGYTGVLALHPYKPEGYYRDKAYPNMGFDRFVSEGDFPDPDSYAHIGTYTSDKAAYEKLIKEYERMESVKTGSFFGFEVTMQNHSPYRKTKNQEVVITNENYKNEDAENYLNYVHESDKALKYLIGYYSKIKKPTVICFFGDHPPGIKGDFYRKLAGLEADMTDAETVMETRKTPFVIWANYDIKAEDIGVSSANYLSEIMIQKTGMKLTGYQRFLKALREKVPVINGIGYLGRNGKYYQIDDDKSPYYKWIQNYKILEYNNLVDIEGRIKNFF